MIHLFLSIFLLCRLYLLNPILYLLYLLFLYRLFLKISILVLAKHRNMISFFFYDLTGMGYAMLANIPPIVGIYTAFFPVLIYFILGTSKHNSMGTFAVVSIMVGKTVMKHATESVTFTPVSNSSESAIDTEPWSLDQPTYSPIQVVTTVSLVVGCIQVIMYVLRLGIISSLLSETLVSGFTTGAGIHVVTSQVKDLIGVHLTPVVGNFKVILVTHFYFIISIQFQ